MPSEYLPLLPKLKSGPNNQVANFREAGVWDERDTNELEKLSDSLKVEQVATQINSIPDMWARPLLFDMSLYDSEHLLHNRTVAEWRGMLALLAFKEIKGFNLRVVEVVHRNARSEVIWPRFLEALHKTAPNKSSLSPDTLWLDREKDVYPSVILYRDKPIGMLSPTTLVCTATDCFNRLTGIVWSDGRYLKDPSGVVKENVSETVQELNRDQKKLLAAWLDKLHYNLATLANPTETNPRLNKLLGYLKNYQSDLGDIANLRIDLANNGFGLTKAIFKFLDKPIDAKTPSESHVRLKPSEGMDPAKTYYIVDRSISQQWNMPETSVVVCRGATLADVPFGGLGRERRRIENIALEENAELCLPEDIFTEKLCLVYQEGALPGAMTSAGSGSLRVQNQIVTPLLPLTEKILSHVNNEELQKNVTFEQSSESIHVRIRLMLSGPDGSGRFVEFRREYGKDALLILESVPVLEVWPNFRKDGWKLYFTYFSKGGRESTFYGKPFLLSGAVAPKTIKGEGKKIESQITRTECFPTAILCYALSPNVQSNRMDEQYAGLILLKAPELIADVNDAWKIGVDFGTTSTSVYTSFGNYEGEPLVFRKELLARITASGSERALLYDEFVPGETEEIPFLSFYQEFHNRNKGQVIDIISDGHIFFLDKSKELAGIPKNVATNLKWSGDDLDRDRATAFIQQVCYHALAETASKGASKVSWRYSYPTAFSEMVSSGLPVKWQQIVDHCVQATGIQSIDGAPRKMSESHASAVYFADKLSASTNYGTICIDIGGGTSDIAIWQADELRHQVSLRLAGREIFLNTLRSRPEFLNRFGTNISLLQSLKSRSIEFYAQADAIISRDGDRWFQQLPNKIGLPETKGFIQIIAIGLSGLFYYIGLALRYLMDKGKYRPEVPDIYIGGSGSRMFHWVSAGAFSSESTINELLRDVFREASGLELSATQPMKIVLSPKPKCEAALGLVGNKDLSVARDSSEDSAVVSGEKIIFQQKKFDFDTLVNASMFKDLFELPTKLEKTESFIKIFNRYATKKGAAITPIDYESISTDLRKRLGGKLKDFSKKNPKDISVEPIFILALKTLLEISAEEWKSSN